MRPSFGLLRSVLKLNSEDFEITICMSLADSFEMIKRPRTSIRENVEALDSLSELVWFCARFVFAHGLPSFLPSPVLDQIRRRFSKLMPKQLRVNFSRSKSVSGDPHKISRAYHSDANSFNRLTLVFAGIPGISIHIWSNQPTGRFPPKNLRPVARISIIDSARISLNFV